MNMIAKVLSGAGFALVLAALVSSEADARSLTGFAGKIQSPGTVSASCFSEANGTVTSTCANDPPNIWEIFLPVDTSFDGGVGTGSFSPVVNITGGNCAALTVNENGTLFKNTGFLPMVPGNNTLGPVTVPSGGSLFMACQMPQNITLNSVVW